LRPDKLKKRRQEKALATLANLGIDTECVVLGSAERLDSAPETLERQGEAALAFLAHPTRFVTKECIYCGEWFGTNYNSVGYCSNHCRDKHFERQTGMKVNWGAKDLHQRWLHFEPPLVIDPDTLRQLAGLYETMQKRLQYLETQIHIPEIPQDVEPEPHNKTAVQTIPLLEPAPAFEFGLTGLEEFFGNP